VIEARPSIRPSGPGKIYGHEIEEKTQKASGRSAVIGKLNPGGEKDFQKALDPVYKKYAGAFREARR